MDEQARHRTIIRDGVVRAAIQATCLSVPVAAFAVVASWGYNPAGSLMAGLLIVGIWVGCAAAVGHGVASAKAAAMRDREKAVAEDAKRPG